jgi:hypothetical protein
MEARSKVICRVGCRGCGYRVLSVVLIQANKQWFRWLHNDLGAYSGCEARVYAHFCTSREGGRTLSLATLVRKVVMLLDGALAL